MATVTIKGTPIHTNGELPQVGAKAPEFVLVDSDLKDHHLKDFGGRRKLLSIVPSLDTATCALSAKKFNDEARKDPNLMILFISADLPFAQKRVCGSEGLDNIRTLSMMRNKDFARDYGVLITDGPLAGIAARSVLVLDETNKVLYRELVPEITQEPNYREAIKALLAK